MAYNVMSYKKEQITEPLNKKILDNQVYDLKTF